MNSVPIDFSSIRPLHGSKAEGFEELCAQLARIESPKEAHFVRTGSPDAGVECYIVFPNGDEWGWQAKYFATLGDSQLAQLDKSVQTALDKHPRLKKYFVCIPLNLADPRLVDKKSAKQRWDEHVEKWLGWAKGQGIDLEFVWQGRHELMVVLLRTSSAGLLRYWFEVTVFDERWFECRLEEAIKTAGPRYTAEINVTLPIAKEFEAFGRTEYFLNHIKSFAKGLRDKGRRLDDSKRALSEPGLEATISGIGQQLQGVLDSLGALSPQPIGEIPLSEIAGQLSTTYDSTEQLEKMLREMEYARKSEEPKEEKRRTDSSLRDCTTAVYSLSAELHQAREAMTHASDVANSAVMILTGSAGAGKTHLLCDVAKQRLMSSRPTVLLMGQRFLSFETPWTQALQQLDLAVLSSDEFVGALAASAQAANCRALVLIDAINEGEGRRIWPPHISAFLRQIRQSPWIGVVLSVRSSYEEIVLPEEVRGDAITIRHHGFAECEYDAVRTFFVYYDIELPSTPLLAPEFQNPLFLKTLCTGLHETGQRRLPRGFQGISAVFDLYFGAMNSRLASALDFDPKKFLVREALKLIANAMIQEGKRWLRRTDAESSVNALLPGTGFSKSLYRGLVDEGALIEDVARASESVVEDIVVVAYERLADHLIASALLMSHLDKTNPAVGFQPGGPLAFLWDQRQYVPSGLIEAMCIQIPELTGQELIDLAPQMLQRWDIGTAFRQSLVWRALSAFSEGTRAAFNRLIRTDSDLAESLDVLLTVATLPEHPLNAHFLNRMLRRYQMPERDSFWSVYLHRAFGQHEAVDRLVDWSFAVKSGTELDKEAVDLCATALMWMLTTSNRFLRDRATQATVNLLTGRLDAVTRLVKLFEDVDDPYVRERLYAIAYGVAMRSSDISEIGALANQVYSSVFESGRPIPHLLLRDYARGVIERALFLGACTDVVVEKIRPPYQSDWPRIPTEEEIKPLLPDWSRGSHDSGDVTWAHNRIGDSVMQDDFGRYVIGTNSGSTDWLALRLRQKRWTSPDVLLSSLVATFSEEERSAWDKFELAQAEVSTASFSKMLAGFKRKAESERSNIDDEDESNDDPTLAAAERKLDASQLALEGVLTKKNNRLLRSILKKKKANGGRPPKLDLRLIQRYVLWRVFNLGWTTDRFGKFDRFQAGHYGREASKAERIGKKYQWIAYHEIMALVADHFQYHEEFQRERADQSYEGPWQDFFRGY